MARKKPSLSLERLNERASAEFVPTDVSNETDQSLKLLPLESISDRLNINTRPLNQKHVNALADSISVLGLITPLTVDCQGRLLAGGHRQEALQKLAFEQPERFTELFPVGIPVRVMALDASVDQIDAIQIEIEENTQRKNFTPAEIRDAARRLEEAGYERLRGRPRPGQKSLKRELANVFRLSEDRIQRILNNSDQKGRRTPTFSKDAAVLVLERWEVEIGTPVSSEMVKIQNLIQSLIQELTR